MGTDGKIVRASTPRRRLREKAITSNLSTMMGLNGNGESAIAALRWFDDAVRSGQRDFRGTETDRVKDLIARGYVHAHYFRPLLGDILVRQSESHPFTEKAFEEMNRTNLERVRDSKAGRALRIFWVAASAVVLFLITVINYLLRNYPWWLTGRYRGRF